MAQEASVVENVQAEATNSVMIASPDAIGPTESIPLKTESTDAPVQESAEVRPAEAARPRLPAKITMVAITKASKTAPLSPPPTAARASRLLDKLKKRGIKSPLLKDSKAANECESDATVSP